MEFLDRLGVDRSSFTDLFSACLGCGARVQEAGSKLIVKGSTRMDAIKKLRRAVSETIIDGVPTNLGFIYAILYDKDFILGNIDTNYVANKEAELLESMHVTGE